MNTKGKVSALAALGAFAIFTAPTYAQERAGKQELSVYGGELFGDEITDRAISGAKPKLDDDVTYGIRYAYNLTNAFGLEASLGETQTSVTKLAGPDVDLDLTTLDLDAVYHFDTGTRLVPYVLAGVGYAQANLDHPIAATVNGQPVTIDDDESFTANAGAGLAFQATDNVAVRLEARYRYLDKVVDRFDDSLNSVETTLGVAWKF